MLSYLGQARFLTASALDEGLIGTSDTPLVSLVLPSAGVWALTAEFSIYNGSGSNKDYTATLAGPGAINAGQMTVDVKTAGASIQAISRYGFDIPADFTSHTHTLVTGRSEMNVYSFRFTASAPGVFTVALHTSGAGADQWYGNARLSAGA